MKVNCLLFVHFSFKASFFLKGLIEKYKLKISIICHLIGVQRQLQAQNKDVVYQLQEAQGLNTCRRCCSCCNTPRSDPSLDYDSSAEGRKRAKVTKAGDKGGEKKDKANFMEVFFNSSSSNLKFGLLFAESVFEEVPLERRTDSVYRAISGKLKDEDKENEKMWPFYELLAADYGEELEVQYYLPE